MDQLSLAEAAFTLRMSPEDAWLQICSSFGHNYVTLADIKFYFNEYSSTITEYALPSTKPLILNPISVHPTILAIENISTPLSNEKASSSSEKRKLADTDFPSVSRESTTERVQCLNDPSLTTHCRRFFTRTLILYCFFQNMQPTECEVYICGHYGSGIVDCHTVKLWYGKFETGDFQDEHRSGAPHKVHSHVQ